MIRLLLSLALLWVLQAVAVAHSSKGGHVYERYCCNGNDCSEISDDAVTAGPEGYIITLRKGEHPMVTSPMVRHVVPYRQARPSTDGKFHACLFPTENFMRCFYAIPGGV